MVDHAESLWDSRPVLGAQLHERVEEVAQIVAAIERARSGDGQLVLLEAAAGGGKSALISATQAAATSAGLRVLHARGGELERDFAFGAVRQLFAPVVDRATRTERDRRLGGAAAGATRIFDQSEGDEGADADALQAGYAVASGLHGLVVNVADEAPLLLAVDDAHWLDEASLRWLDFLARRIDAVPVVVVVAFRHGEPGADAAGLDELRSHPGALILRPAPLSINGVAELIAARGSQADDDRIAAYHRASGGNPLYLQELLRLGPLSAADLATTALPELGDRVARRVAKASPEGPALAASMAILGDGADLRHAAAVCDLDHERAAAIARQLRQIEILASEDPVSFVHPVVRQSVEDTLSTAERARLHRAAATVLADAQAPIEAVAAHLALLPPSGSVEVAAHLMAAGRDAVARAAPAAAVARFRRALDEGAAVPHRAEVLFELGQAQMAMRDPAAVASLREASTIASSPSTMVRAAITLSELLGHAGQWRDAIHVTKTTMAQVPVGDDELRAELEAFRAVLASNDSNLVVEFDRDLAEFERIAQGESWAARALSGLLGATASARGADHEAVVRQIDHAVEDGVLLSRAGGAWAGAQVVGALIEQEDYARAAVLADEIEHIGRRTGVMIAVVTGSGFSALGELRRGRVAASEARLLGIMEVATDAGMPMWLITLASFAADAMIERPALAPVIELADSIEIEERFAASASGAMLLEARGLFALARGERARAASEFRAAGAVYTPLGWGPPRTLWRSYLAMAVALDDPAEARELAAADLATARGAGNRRAEGIALRAAGLVAGGEEGIELLRASVECLGRSEALLDLTRSRVELGAALRRSGQRAEGREQLAAGVELADRCGALHLLARAEDELRAAGARPRRRAMSGVAALTASEARVVRLAADGRSNVEIAQDLYVGVKTIETHLSRAYAKLGLAGQGSRARLRELLGEEPRAGS